MNILEPGEISRLEITKPDKDIIRLTEKILDQNKMILEMNAKLLLVLTAPIRVMEKHDTGLNIQDIF